MVQKNVLVEKIAAMPVFGRVLVIILFYVLLVSTSIGAKSDMEWVQKCSGVLFSFSGCMIWHGIFSFFKNKKVRVLISNMAVIAFLIGALVSIFGTPIVLSFN